MNLGRVHLDDIQIRIRHYFMAIRIADPATGKRSMLMIPDAQGRGRGLPGGASVAHEQATITLMRYVREQLCFKYGLYELEIHLVSALQGRRINRLVGGGTYYVPHVNEQGFQSFDGYVVVDAPRSMLASLSKEQATELALFDATSGLYLLGNAPSRLHMTPIDMKRFLLSLLRMRYQEKRIN